MALSVDIRKRFKDFALDIRFESDGRTLGILGASGSGKSMTLQAIAGIVTPDEGRIELNGRVLFDTAKRINLRPQQRRVGYLFQHYALFPHMTVAQNIACALDAKLDARQKADTVAALLRRFELEGLGGRTPAQLSGGQQQRAALARCLAYRPEALLLDEPFAALDTHLQERLQLEMLALLERYPGDALMVTHSRDEVYKLCPNLLVIEGGQALAQGGTRALFQNPGQLQVARLTGCKNISRAERLDDGALRALDWGVTLRSARPAPGGVTHVGVRAHDWRPPRGGEAPQNLVPVRAARTLEEPFEWSVLFCPGGEGDALQEIRWPTPTAPGPLSLPDALTVDPENVLLLS